MPPLRLSTRSSAQTRYRTLRQMSFQEAMAQLAASGIEADLRPIDAAALAACGEWHNRRVTWPWAERASDWRRGHPERFEVALWSGDVLCGLALGRPSKGPSHLALYYVEGRSPDHPLQGKVTAVVLTALQAYAIALGKKELRLVDPLPDVIPFYCSPALGFQLVTPGREAPYCRRSI